MLCHDATLTQPQGGSPSQGLNPTVHPVLTVLASRFEPERVGEVLILPAGASSEGYVLGRGGGEPSAEQRLGLCQQVPGGIVPTGPLASPYASRRQIAIRPVADQLVEFENLGRVPMHHNGIPADKGVLAPGDLLEIEDQWLFLLELRPAWLPTPGNQSRHQFGEVDVHGIVGETHECWKLRERISNLAPRPGHVLISGASGSGKELVARALHRLSPRGPRTLISRNAATLPEGIIDAELFGNVRNYPNTGMPARPGLIGDADGSTLFLDEFAELPLGTQAHLLRVLDDGEYQPLGQSKPIRSDFRLIAATNRPESELREDLLARFRWRLRLPSLNERIADIPLIARHILQTAGLLSATQLQLDPKMVFELVRHTYRTNVRELEQLLITRHERLSPCSIPQALQPKSAAPRLDSERPSSTPAGTLFPEAPGKRRRSRLQPDRIQQVLDESNGSLEKTWRALGLSSRHVLTRLIRKYGITVRRTRPAARIKPKPGAAI